MRFIQDILYECKIIATKIGSGERGERATVPVRITVKLLTVKSLARSPHGSAFCSELHPCRGANSSLPAASFKGVIILFLMHHLPPVQSFGVIGSSTPAASRQQLPRPPPMIMPASRRARRKRCRRPGRSFLWPGVSLRRDLGVRPWPVAKQCPGHDAPGSQVKAASGGTGSRRLQNEHRWA